MRLNVYYSTIYNSQDWKQPIYPSTDKWINNLWYLVEYYSAIQRNKFESVLVRWMCLEPVIQSEVSEN